ncbi:MAG: 50S ribosomal protein L6 [Sphingomonadales bacterium]
MSRIGKKPVAIPAGVEVKIDGRAVTAKGPKGELNLQLVREVSASLQDNGVLITPIDQSKRTRSMWGMQRSMVNNLVTGVSQGFNVKLEMNGVGYRAAVKGDVLELQLGFSHDVHFPIPKDMEIKCASSTNIEISGIDRQRVGQVAAEIRAFRKPEPYKGKGIKYAGETIYRKEGKKK